MRSRKATADPEMGKAAAKTRRIVRKALETSDYEAVRAALRDFIAETMDS